MRTGHCNRLVQVTILCEQNILDARIALHATARSTNVFAIELKPNLVCTVDAEVLVINAPDFNHKCDVTSYPRR